MVENNHSARTQAPSVSEHYLTQAPLAARSEDEGAIAPPIILREIQKLEAYMTF